MPVVSDIGRRLRPPSGEIAAGALLAVTVFCFFLGSSSLPELAGPGRTLRWLALFTLTAYACVLAGLDRSAALARPMAWIFGLGAWLAAVCVVSTVWSADPKLTFERAGSFGLLLVAAGAFALAARSRPQLPRRLLEGVLAAATAGVVAGLVMLLTSYRAAIPTSDLPARFQGLGENPDTLAMIEGLAVPIALWSALQARSWRSRLLPIASFVLLVGAISASGSRGGLLAASVGGLVFAAALRAPLRRRVAVAAVVVLASGAAAAGMTIPKQPPLPPASASGQGQSLSLPTIPWPGSSHVGEAVGPPEQSYNLPLSIELYRTVAHKRLLSSSGRLQSWREAIRQADARPVFGYGFGTEDRVFVDRVYSFAGSEVENSFLGFYLELGAAGAISLVALLAAVCAAAAVAVRRAGAGSPAAPLAGVVAAGIALMLVQSYVYAVGNVATVSFWTAAFLVGAVASAREPEAAAAGAAKRRTFSVAVRPRVAGAAALVLAVLVAIAFAGRWERSHNASVQNARMAAVFDIATSRGLDSRLLDGYRLASRFDCLLFHPPGKPREPSAYELCFSARGRLVQTIDRHTGVASFGSLQEEPSLARIRVAVPRLLAVFAARGALRSDPRLAGVDPSAASLPVHFDDVGVAGFPERRSG